MRATRTRLSVLAGGVLAAVAVVATPAAHATEADTQFLAVVTELGLTFATPDEAVEAGNNVCDIVAEGSSNSVSPAAIRADIINSLLGEGVNEDQATRLMVGAVNAYCPIYNGVVAG
ncbi:Protein of uncharacterised function (DUF732) [Mycolicibacterium aurum]|uniref:Protein of uncharacterized function (DUF732) n=1 Tax=Mycolicibacterium aurum TaxID=1791 RepID=A0A448IYI1_MYCAU|nr:DUF732 domain-containing protein [Mycolicibacterium aurum]VEG57421.1 Protein of uncharacterised function (DUF732) [Mycolicibacterium aurum]